jgi:YidC/Oxa1 family membrane protein insertase
MTNKEDSRNLILALVLSGLVMLGWTYFYGAPQMAADIERGQKAQQGQTGQTQGQAGQGQAGQGQAGQSQSGQAAGTPANPVAAMIAGSRADALGQSQRIVIDTAKISGSIALTGGRIDDVVLKPYFEQAQQKGANIVVLSPEAASDAYYADFGWLGQNIDAPTAKTVWTAPAGAKLGPKSPVTLTFDNGKGLLFSREIAIDDTYMFTIRDKVENKGSAPVTLTPYGVITRLGTPKVLGYYILHEGLLGVIGDELQTATYSAQAEAGQTNFEKSTGGWIGITDKYWAATIIPDQARPFTAQFGSEGGARQTYRTAASHDAMTIAPGASSENAMRLFAGAKEVRTVDGYENALGINKFELLIDWGIFYFLTKPLFWLMDWFFHFFGNFGVAILLVTLVIKAIFFPLANKSYASMAKMKAVQPQMKALQERHKDDKTALQKEMMELYKREKINPVSGCLPVLIQIPVFFALYKVLFVTIEMRHAPFFGWIQDLSAGDPTSIFNLFGLLPFEVPAFLHIGVWPLLMGITMWLQMKMNPEPTDPVQKTLFSWMPIVFTFMLASFPAGLVIYWAWNNFLSILQQYFIMKRYNVKIELWDNLRGLFKKKAAPAE